jgi:signal transduction histidine kinase
MRMDRFIKDIVDHSRNTRLQVTPEPVDFELMISNALEQLQFMEKFGKIRKAIHVEQDRVFYTSATRMDIILNNLFSNVMKYADLRKDDPFMQVTVKCADHKAEIKITDNGEGINQDALPKIFDMFYRGSGSGSGSGLGLYIVKEALQKIQGNITVTSEFAKGTEFVVTIPDLAVKP